MSLSVVLELSKNLITTFSDLIPGMMDTLTSIGIGLEFLNDVNLIRPSCGVCSILSFTQLKNLIV